MIRQANKPATTSRIKFEREVSRVDSEAPTFKPNVEHRGADYKQRAWHNLPSNDFENVLYCETERDDEGCTSIVINLRETNSATKETFNNTILSLHLGDVAYLPDTVALFNWAVSQLPKIDGAIAQVAR